MIRETRVWKAGAAGAEDEPRDDRIAMEAPLEIRLGRGKSTVLMRTPGQDEELVRGFLVTEGLVTRAEEIVDLVRPQGLSGDEIGNVIQVTLRPGVDTSRLERLFYGSSSCGVCGKATIGQLHVHSPGPPPDVRISPALLLELPARMRAAQEVFAATGGLHAAALFDLTGALQGLREDVGRHNAVDKLVGWALTGPGLPLSGVLLVSGRVGFEIVQKAIVAGVPVIAAVGAPTSVAVDLAEEFGVTLVGFLRNDSMNIYAGRERLAP